MAPTQTEPTHTVHTCWDHTDVPVHTPPRVRRSADTSHGPLGADVEGGSHIHPLVRLWASRCALTLYTHPVSITSLENVTAP